MKLFQRFPQWLILLAICFWLLPATALRAEEDGGEDTAKEEAPAAAAKSTKKEQKRKYMIYDPNRVDAGIFYVGFAAGGNFYIEPKISSTTKAPLGS